MSVLPYILLCILVAQTQACTCILDSSNINCNFGATNGIMVPPCCINVTINIPSNYTLKINNSTSGKVDAGLGIGPYCSWLTIVVYTPYFDSYPSSALIQQLGVISNLTIDYEDYNRTYIVPPTDPPQQTPDPSVQQPIESSVLCEGEAPASEFVCLDGVWTGFNISTTSPIVISSPTVVIGNLTVPSIIIISELNVTGCILTGSIEYAPSQVPLQPTKVVSQDESCANPLPILQVTAPTSPDCFKYETKITGEATLYVQLMKIPIGTCGRKQNKLPIIIGVIVGVVALVAVIAFLSMFWLKFQHCIRPFSRRRNKGNSR